MNDTTEQIILKELAREVATELNRMNEFNGISLSQLQDFLQDIIKAYYHPEEPTDDQTFNQYGMEGGVNYKS